MRLAQLDLYSPSRVSQTAAILADLRSGQAVTPLEALDRYGSMRLAARIAELRAAGHPIMTIRRRTPDGKTYAAYRLVDQP